MLDFNMIIEDYDFFYQLKPRLRYKVVMELFSDFKHNFRYLFDDENFRAGQEFIASFISNLYCRIFIPN